LVRDPGIGRRGEGRQASAQRSCDAPEGAQPFDGYFGRSTYQEAVDRFLSFDLVIHRWDVARAVGLDDEIAPDDVERLGHAAQGFGDALRDPEPAGPALEPLPDADEQTRLLAFLGRKAWT
jgi:hypothetical protein